MELCATYWLAAIDERLSRRGTARRFGIDHRGHVEAGFGAAVVEVRGRCGQIGSTPFALSSKPRRSVQGSLLWVAWTSDIRAGGAALHRRAGI